MDLLVLVVGIIFTVCGAKMKGYNGMRTGGGITMITLGVVLLVIGGVWFSLGFIDGFTRGFNAAVK